MQEEINIRNINDHEKEEKEEWLLRHVRQGEN
jgi:hypothetical protein